MQALPTETRQRQRKLVVRPRAPEKPEHRAFDIRFPAQERLSVFILEASDM